MQLANFWTPTSGGLRVVMDNLAQRYRARGHDVLQIVPGAEDGHEIHPWGRRATVSAPSIPGTGYRMIVRTRRVERMINAFVADVVEVSDRATLLRPAERSRNNGVATVMVAHERLDQILPAGGYGSMFDAGFTRRVADGWNPRCRNAVDAVVVPSRYGADEWHRVGIRPHVVPWGVNVDRFRPEREPGAELSMVWVGRLAPEKRPELAVAALDALEDRGVSCHLTIVGDGPLADPMRAASVGRNIRLVGHVSEPSRMRHLVSGAHVSLSTSGVETFGLAVLESLACGTPVVACRGGAAGDVAGGAGRTVEANGQAIAAAVLALVQTPRLRQVARARALEFSWDNSVERMLDVHRRVVESRPGTYGARRRWGRPA